jgi:hypothetical protein
MSWQDLVFGVGSLVFIVALIPALFSEEKPPLSTSIPTSLVLISFSLTYATLDLPFAAITGAISGCMWGAIAILKHRRING